MKEYTYSRSPMAEWSEESGNRFIPYPNEHPPTGGKHYNYLHDKN